MREGNVRSTPLMFNNYLLYLFDQYVFKDNYKLHQASTTVETFLKVNHGCGFVIIQKYGKSCFCSLTQEVAYVSVPRFN